MMLVKYEGQHISYVFVNYCAHQKSVHNSYDGQQMVRVYMYKLWWTAVMCIQVNYDGQQIMCV